MSEKPRVRSGCRRTVGVLPGGERVEVEQKVQAPSQANGLNYASAQPITVVLESAPDGDPGNHTSYGA